MNEGHVKLTATMAKAAALLMDDKKAANDIKVRILKAGLGQMLMIPDNWNELSEDEKERRLDKAIEAGCKPL